MSTQKTVPAGEVRKKLSEILSVVGFGNQRVVLTKNNKPVACVVSIADLELILKAESQQVVAK